MFRLISILVFLLSFSALAQTFSGSYFLTTDNGMIELELSQTNTTKLTGTLRGNGNEFYLEGDLDDQGAGVAYGVITMGEERLLFEAYLKESQLTLSLFGLTESGELDYDNAQELTFQRQESQAAASNPLAPAKQTSNPLAQGSTSDIFAGQFSGTGLSLSLEPSSAGYQGKLEINSQVYPVIATASDTTLTGEFETGGSRFAFTANLSGNQLSLKSDGQIYTLTKESLASSQNPLAQPLAQNTDNSPILAQGANANLSQDNALAFVEALEFSLQQAGYSYSFTDAEKQQILETLAQSFPQADAQNQAVLAQAREIWTRVQQNWASSNQDDQREFVVGVFTLAFGEETVKQWLSSNNSGTTQAGQSEGGCSNIDDCASRYMDYETWQDTSNAQGCWAAAGCSSYDSSTNTYEYNDPSY